METKKPRIKGRRKPDAMGKDEMNLAEFPLAVISKRGPDKQRVVFAWTTSTGVIRRVIIGPSAFGFPTPQDDEVLVGLIQLAKRLGFATRELYFSRYQLIQELGWDDSGKSYERIDLAINRLCGVSYHWENSWWDKENQSWVDENFGILDNSQMYDREKQLAKAGKVAQLSLPLSMVLWNERIFQSFKSGYLKDLDMDLFRTLKSPVAKRLYRYLDKHFYRPNNQVMKFDLQEFARSKLGFLGEYSNSRLEQLLSPAIAELEKNWPMLKPASRHQRFQRVGRGSWQLVFERCRVERQPKSKAGDELPMVTALVDRQVELDTARKLVSEFPAERVQEKIEFHDWLLIKGEKPDNPPGFLVQSIVKNYPLPPNFETIAQREAKRQAAAEKKRQLAEREKAEREQAAEVEEARRQPVREYLEALTPLELQRVEEDALSYAQPFIRKLYLESRKTPSGMGDLYRENMLFTYVTEVILCMKTNGAEE